MLLLQFKGATCDLIKFLFYKVPCPTVSFDSYVSFVVDNGDKKFGELTFFIVIGCVIFKQLRVGDCNNYTDY